MAKKQYLIKHLVRELKETLHTSEFHRFLLLHEMTAFEEMLNIKGQVFPGLKYTKSDKKLLPKIYIPYMIDKIITYCNLDNRGAIPNKQTFIKLYNTCNEAGNGIIFSKDPDKTVKAISFYMGLEQITIQRKIYLHNYQYRIFNLYKEYPEVNEYIISEYGLPLNKIILLIMCLLAFIKEHGEVIVGFSKKNLLNYLSSIEITEDELNFFMNKIVITQEEFQKKYEHLRFDRKLERLIHFEKLQGFDKYLPKVCFYYPFLKSKNDEQILLLSYTGLIKFMECQWLFSNIYENKTIKDFKSRIHGPAIESYLKNYIKSLDYKNVSGNSIYYKNNNKRKSENKCDEPDVIIEMEDYVIFIESKSMPFSMLNIMQNFDKNISERTKEDLKKSEENVNKFLTYRKSFKGKRIFKFLCYFVHDIETLSPLIFDFKPKSKDEFIITDILSLELLFLIENNKIDEVIENYIIDINSNSSASTHLSSYLEDNYFEQINDNRLFEFCHSEVKNIFHNI